MAAKRESSESKMKVGDLVREKYPTKRIGIIVAIWADAGGDTCCEVKFVDGGLSKPLGTWHYWRLGDEV